MEEIKIGCLTFEADRKGGRCILLACDADAVEVEIPARVDGLAVVAIGERAFEDCRLLKSVAFPTASAEEIALGEALGEIWEHAFANCTSLCEVMLPESIVTLGYGAFYGCTSLKVARFSAWTYVGDYAFAGCSALCEVSRSYGIGEGAFSFCSSLASLPITDSIEVISEDCFEHCDSLREIVIPESVIRIDPLAFRGCARLARVIFARPDGWCVLSGYTGKETPLDLGDPEENAHALARMDFDDGVIAWRRHGRG